jgi:hypothetical protein
VKIVPRAKAACARRGRAVLGVEQPVVGTHRVVEPDRVIEARRHDGPSAPLRPCGSTTVSSSYMSEA